MHWRIDDLDSSPESHLLLPLPLPLPLPQLLPYLILLLCSEFTHTIFAHILEGRSCFRFFGWLRVAATPWSCCRAGQLLPAVLVELARSRVAFIFMQFTCQPGLLLFLESCFCAAANSRLATLLVPGCEATNNICHIWHDGNYFRVLCTSRVALWRLPVCLSVCSSVRLSVCRVVFSPVCLFVCLPPCLLTFYRSICSSPWRVHFLRMHTSPQKCWFLATWKQKPANSIQQIKFKQSKRAKSSDCRLHQIARKLAFLSLPNKRRNLCPSFPTKPLFCSSNIVKVYFQ